jgi:hypothetical protein
LLKERVSVGVSAMPLVHSPDFFGLDIDNLANLDNRICDHGFHTAFFADNLDSPIKLPSQSCIPSSHSPVFGAIECIGGLTKVFSFYVAFRGSIETASLLYIPSL